MFKKLLLIGFSCFFFLSTYAQTVSGTVLAEEDGLPLPGATVQVKGQSTGTTTDIDGKFTLDAKSGDTLVFSSIGFAPLQFPIVQAATPINISLKNQAVELNVMVVTALGVSKKQKSLGYSIAKIDPKEVTTVQEANVVNSLSGKVAGIQVSKTSGGPESSSRVVLRGNSSLQKDNQPLFVVDGVPIDNTTFGAAGQWGGLDYGSPISDINPDDIESMTVLKGPNAAALYGSRAANGVIIITTKKGTSRKGIGVSFSTTASVQLADIQHKFQNEYGAGSNGQFILNQDGIPEFDKSTIPKSWGPRMNGQQFVDWDGVTRTYSPQPDNYKEFFQTGYTFTNSLALSGGNEKSTYRFSYSDLRNRGIVPNSTFQKRSLGMRTTSRFGEKLSADGKFNYIWQEAVNRQNQSDGRGVARNYNYMPRSISTESLRDYEDVNGNEKTWNEFFSGYQTNPFWMANKNRNEDSRDRILGRIQLRYDLSEFVFVSAGSGIDMYFENRSNLIASGSDGNSAGGYSEGYNNYREVNSDFLIGVSRPINEKWSFSAAFGGAQLRQEGEGNSLDAQRLAIEDFYNPTNVDDLSNLQPSFSKFEKRINSLYATSRIDYRSVLFLDVSGRNDWSSALPENNNSFFYPSVNLAYVFSDHLDLTNKWFSFGKVRTSWARVGSDGSPYLTTNSFQQSPAVSFDGQPLYIISQPLANKDLKPEFTTSVEAGIDLNFYGQRIGLDLTVYNAVTTNQIATVPISSASGFNSAVVNAGEIRNRGLEILLNIVPIQKKKFKWSTTFNFSKNQSLVREIETDGDIFPLAEHWNVTIGAEAGDEFGNIYGYGIQRDGNGEQLVDANGFFLRTDTPVKLGNYNPDWLLGVSNYFTYGNWSMSFLIDIKRGGQIYSASNMYAHGYGGTVEETLEGREEWYASEEARQAAGVSSQDWTPTGGYQVEGIYAEGTVIDGEDVSGQAYNGFVNPEEYWLQFAQWTDEIHEPHVYDAGYVKLRELYIGYSFSKQACKKLRLQGLEAGIVGRNLWLIQSDVPNIDPEAGYNNGNGQGVEYGTFPISRSIGLNIKFNF